MAQTPILGARAVSPVPTTGSSVGSDPTTTGIPGSPTDVEAALAALEAQILTLPSPGIIPWSYAQLDGGLAGDGTTDDTTAFQTWIDTVTASGTQSGWFWFEPGTYLIGGALQDTGAFNGQILLPSRSTSDPQITLRFSGPVRPPLAVHGGIPAPGGYAILKSSLTGASGTAAVISGGNGSYPTQNNIEVIIENLICLAPGNPTMSWWNLSTCQGGGIDGVYVSTTDDWVGTRTQPTHSNAYGIKLPQWNQSNQTYNRAIVVGGFYTGVLQGELSYTHMAAAFCINAVEVPFLQHPMEIHMEQTACTYGIKVTGAHPAGDIYYDAEHFVSPAWAATVFDVDDGSNYLYGNILWWGVATGGSPDHSFTINGGAHVVHAEFGQSTAGVTSVALSMPAEFSVAGSPVTSTGTLAVTKANQNANLIYAGPNSGAAAAPTFRQLVAADIPAGVAGAVDHEHIMDVLMSGDASTLAFELPAAPFDAYSVAAYVAGTLTEITLSGALLTTATFGSAPGSGTNNIRFDIVAAAA